MNDASFQHFVEPVPVHRSLEDHAALGPALHQGEEVLRAMMLDATFGKAPSCVIHSVVNAVTLVIVDANVSIGLGAGSIVASGGGL